MQSRAEEVGVALGAGAWTMEAYQRGVKYPHGTVLGQVHLLDHLHGRPYQHRP